MPYVNRSVWVDDETGPDAFISIPLSNQRIWDKAPDKAAQVICEALATGGFTTDYIDRKAGNYEGQIMAIRAGFVDKMRSEYRINAAGKAFLQAHGKPVPAFLPAVDIWHNLGFDYCVYEIESRGAPALRIAEKLIPCGGSLGMVPVLRKADAEVLRDYLSDWLARV